jgi:hypothetical protein
VTVRASPKSAPSAAPACARVCFDALNGRSLLADRFSESLLSRPPLDHYHSVSTVLSLDR